MAKCFWMLSLYVICLLPHSFGSSVPDVSSITAADLERQIKELATFSETPAPSVTRHVFTPQDVDARKHIKGLMQEAGLAVREDVMGNIYGRWQGSDASAGAVMSGSHADSIELGGAYDGTVGVLGAIAALKALRGAGFKPLASLEAVMFATEEAGRFNVPCLGSRGITGQLEAHVLETRRDENGTNFVQAASAVGYVAEDAQAYAKQTLWEDFSRIATFVELHIEQGPYLEAAGVQIGVVEAIAAPSMIRIEFSGKGGHGGGMPMKQRNDPSMAASELALAIEKAALATGASETVATVGLWRQEPNVYNAIPRRVQLDIDIRDTDDARRDAVLSTAFQAAADIAARRDCNVSSETVFKYPVGVSDRKVTDAIQAAADDVGATSMRMISRGYHDAGLMAQVAPTAMIFIPCRNGLSHHPDEYAAPEDMERGVKTLALTMARLAGGTVGGAAPDHVEL